MWNNYFYQIRKKYSMRLSTKNPLVINLDGKDVTKNKNMNIIININNQSFLNKLEKTVEYFTDKYECLAIYGADEVSFIFEEPMKLINDLNTDQSTYSTEVISVFSQYFYDYYNNCDLHQKIFWHGKCFSIPEGKIKSYIKYKSKLIQVLVTTYFLKKKGIISAGQIPLEEKKKLCKQYNDYNTISDIENGTLYFKGKKIDIEEFYKGNIKILNNIDETIFENLFNDIK